MDKGLYTHEELAAKVRLAEGVFIKVQVLTDVRTPWGDAEKTETIAVPRYVADQWIANHWAVPAPERPVRVKA